MRLAFVIIIIIIFLLLIFLFHLGSFPFLTTPAHLEGAEGIIQEGAAPHGHCLVQPWTSDQAEGNCEERKVLLAWPAEARQAAEQGNHPIVVSDTKHPSSEPLKIHSHPPLVFLFVSFWVFLSREKIKNVFFFLLFSFTSCCFHHSSASPSLGLSHSMIWVQSELSGGLMVLQ